MPDTGEDLTMVHRFAIVPLEEVLSSIREAARPGTGPRGRVRVGDARRSRRSPPGGRRTLSLLAAALADEAQSMAGWLGLERVIVGDRGDLSTDLARSIRR
ncbi:MAG: hypothetical protein ACRD2W_01040 [Acidimicrobiales bacterium]